MPCVGCLPFTYTFGGKIHVREIRQRGGGAERNRAAWTNKIIVLFSSVIYRRPQMTGEDRDEGEVYFVEHGRLLNEMPCVCVQRVPFELVYERCDVCVSAVVR